MVTPKQASELENLVLCLEALTKACIEKIMAGKGEIYSPPMVREALTELEQAFLNSPEYRGTDSKTEQN